MVKKRVRLRSLRQANFINGDLFFEPVSYKTTITCKVHSLSLSIALGKPPGSLWRGDLLNTYVSTERIATHQP